MDDFNCTNCGEYVGSPIADRIAALEARIAKADALAATLIYIRDGEKLNTVHMRRAAAVSLAAYREGVM